jgi:hypothetical protein
MGVPAVRPYVLILIAVLLFGASAFAQDARPQPSDPPIAARIAVGAPDADGIVRIDGGQGSVFSNATLAVRNLYTGETVYTVAGGLGGWTARLTGAGETPFWISPNAGSVLESRQAQPGSLPGNIGVIVYGAPTAAAFDGVITQIALDGMTDDWALYPNTGDNTARALVNNDSLYLAISSPSFLTTYARVELVFTIDTITYGVRFDPRQIDTPQLRRLNPGTADFGVTNATYRLNTLARTTLEARIPLDFVDRALRVTFDGARWLDPADGVVANVSVALPALQVDERDGIVRTDRAISTAGVTFDAGGQIPTIDGRWTARGTASRGDARGADVLRMNSGDSLAVQLDVRLTAAARPPAARLVGTLSLQPVAVMGRSTADGDSVFAAVSDTGTNFGWSDARTPSGMPIDNINRRIGLGASGAATVQPYQIVGAGDEAFFPMDWTITLPDDLPTGLYVPVFTGAFVLPDGTIRPWDAPSDARETGDPPPLTRLPLVINVGVGVSVPMPWALFYDTPSDGARGILPDGDAGALSNRVRYNPPTYILPPRAPGDDDLTPYSIEPYLPTMLPNAYSSSSAPLIPLRLPSGQIVARVTRPDGSIDSIGAIPIIQSAISSLEPDERARFGTTSPVDLYRLTTLNPRLTAYTFDQYGEYEIDLRGEVQDRFGNRYTGGGMYRVLIAEPLDLQPAVLSGTPFETGDSFQPGATLYPGVPATVTITLRVYPLDGSPMIERVYSGRANRFGVLSDRVTTPDGSAAAPFVFETPGEYTVDYEARYLGADGRQWAASQRGAGVIAARIAADSMGEIVARGSRYPADDGTRRAWYAEDDPAVVVPFPYHSGDVLWTADDPDARVRPSLHLHDLTRLYSAWLLAAGDPATVIDGVSLARRAVEDELPIGGFIGAGTDVPNYAYLSAVRPGVTARQLIDGSAVLIDPGWTPDDVYNQQIGAGFNGDRLGDYMFLFGGALVRYAAPDGTMQRDAAIYAALAVTTAPDDPRGTRVYPPGRGADGGGDGGALITLRNVEYDAFFHPTGVRPGAILRLGDTFTLSGYAAPPLAADVTAVITAPSGTTRTINGRANAIGYFYRPSDSFVVNEMGVWTIDLSVQPAGRTSAGVIEAPAPSGGALGAADRRYYVYVLASDLDVLDWNPRLTDALIPPAVAYNFGFTLPEGWRDLRARYTLTTPSAIIEDGEIRLSGRSFTYLYNPTILSERYPFLENITRSLGQLGDARAHLTDQRILTFYASGIDSTGTFRSVARSFVLWYDRLISLD